MVISGVILLLCCAAVIRQCITFTVTVTTDGGGRVLCEKYTVHPLDGDTLWIVPNEDAAKYELCSLLVDGVDVTDKVSKNKLKLKWILSDKTVVASFRQSGAAAYSDAVFV